MSDLLQIENYLKNLGVKYKLIDLGGEVFRVEDVIRAGVNPNEIVKTLVIRTKPLDQQNIQRSLNKVLFCALVIRGKDRVDFKKVRSLFGSSTLLRPSALRSSTVNPSGLSLRVKEVKCELASPEEVEKVVGVPIGAVCPILIGIPLIFDRKVMSLKHVNLGSGDLTKGLEMDFVDLLKAVGEYRVEDLV